ncbi:response regulator transcription factor [Burkholderia metallica]|uniref:response regulator transcription factor n=1 Tax=Burkholderia metallica TaxID=488729 RepID=UPI0015751BFE|nr:response regulator transcription factor [Burkholderia metallica]NTZ06306.1 response regulator transcription factor [Burkholderia metallica]
MKEITIRTAFATDSPLELYGMEFLVSTESIIESGGMFRRADELVSSLAREACDVAVIDHAICGRAGLADVVSLGRLRSRFPAVNIVLIVSHEEPALIRSLLKKDRVSVVSKFDDINHIVTAIRASHRGEHHLSPIVSSVLAEFEQRHPRRDLKLTLREIEVIRLFLSGLSVTQIARRFFKRTSTISAHKTSAMKKLGAESNAEFIECASRVDLFDE